MSSILVPSFTILTPLFIGIVGLTVRLFDGSILTGREEQGAVTHSWYENTRFTCFAKNEGITAATLQRPASERDAVILSARNGASDAGLPERGVHSSASQTAIGNRP